LNILFKLKLHIGDSDNFYDIFKFQQTHVKRFKFIVRRMEVQKVLGDIVSPSIFRLHSKNYEVKPFWNDRIQNISNTLFLPSTNSIMKEPKTTTNTFQQKTWFPVQEFRNKELTEPLTINITKQNA